MTMLMARLFLHIGRVSRAVISLSVLNVRCQWFVKRMLIARFFLFVRLRQSLNKRLSLTPRTPTETRHGRERIA